MVFVPGRVKEAICLLLAVDVSTRSVIPNPKISLSESFQKLAVGVVNGYGVCCSIPLIQTHDIWAANGFMPDPCSFSFNITYHGADSVVPHPDSSHA